MNEQAESLDDIQQAYEQRRRDWTNERHSTTRRCIDSGTQIMTPAKPGNTVSCGNCGTGVLVVEVPIRPNDPDDHNTMRVLADHATPALNEAVTHVPDYDGHWKGEAYLTHHTYGVQVHRHADEAERWNAMQRRLRPA